jgi:hypothetical protein
LFPLKTSLARLIRAFDKLKAHRYLPQANQDIDPPEKVRIVTRRKRTLGSSDHDFYLDAAIRCKASQ